MQRLILPLLLLLSSVTAKPALAQTHCHTVPTVSLGRLGTYGLGYYQNSVQLVAIPGPVSYSLTPAPQVQLTPAPCPDPLPQVQLQATPKVKVEVPASTVGLSTTIGTPQVQAQALILQSQPTYSYGFGFGSVEVRTTNRFDLQRAFQLGRQAGRHGR